MLASRSPRRRELLGRAGVEHEAIETGVDDGVLERGGVSPEVWVAALAYLKAMAGLSAASAGSLVLGADTVCEVDGRLLGQPADEAEALAMLRAMSDREHGVLTGVALVWDEGGATRRDVFVDRARVRVGALSEASLAEYVASGLWRGKAGAYNLSERLEAGWPIEYAGDAGTIMGLPMERLAARLRGLGVPGRYDSES